MRIFIFNWHTPYTTLLAKTGHSFEASAWIPQGDGSVGWNLKQRPLPENVKLIEYHEEAVRRLSKGWYDLVICFTLYDLEFVERFNTPVIYFALNSLKTNGKNVLDNMIHYRETVKNFINRHNALFVVVSKLKYDDWKIPGLVIPSGIDVSEFPEYQGNTSKVLTVMNLIQERNLIADYSFFREITKNIPYHVTGLNPGLQNSVESNDYEDLKKIYQSHRIYLNITLKPFEDGYNLAMLEAMATGMPVISVDNPTSPLTDGLNGFISSDREYLKEKVQLLLDNPDLATELGKKAKETVTQKFPITGFINNWNNAFELCLSKKFPL